MIGKVFAKKKKVPCGIVYDGAILETNQMPNKRGLVKTLVVHNREIGGRNSVTQKTLRI